MTDEITCGLDSCPFCMEQDGRDQTVCTFSGNLRDIQHQTRIPKEVCKLQQVREVLSLSDG